LIQLSAGDPTANDTNLYIYPNGSLPVRAYVLNTGVFTEHTDFRGRARLGPNFIHNETNEDLNGAGTAVASVIGSFTYGVSKTVWIESVKVLNGTGAGYLDFILSGLEYVIQDYLRKKECNVVAVLDLSFSGNQNDVLDGAVSSAVSAGIFVAATAGVNKTGNDACNFSPASVSTALVTAESDQDLIFSANSNFGTCVDIIAGSVGLTGLGIDSEQLFPLSFTNYGLGGAMSSGVFALLLSTCVYHQYTPSQLIKVILGAAVEGVVLFEEMPGNVTAIALIEDTPNLLLNTYTILQSFGCVSGLPPMAHVIPINSSSTYHSK